MVCIGYHWFLIQFRINLHKCVFQKSQIARAASASAIWDFWKTHECKLIPKWTTKTVWLLTKNIHEKSYRGMEWPKLSGAQ